MTPNSIPTVEQGLPVEAEVGCAPRNCEAGLALQRFLE